MIHARTTVGNWDIEHYSEPSENEGVSFDSEVLTLLQGRVRLGALDGVAASRVLTPIQVNMGVEITRACLRSIPDLVEAMQAANRELNDPERRPRQDNLMVAVAVADLHLEREELRAVRAGDAEIWVKREGQWEAVLEGDMLTHWAKAEYTKWVQKDPASSWEAQIELLDEPEAWESPLVGMLPELRPLQVVLDLHQVEEVVVSTDGARLNQERVQDLEKWMTSGVHQMPRGHPHPRPHGDLTVLHATRRAEICCVSCRGH